jgi:hypothetical protein
MLSLKAERFSGTAAATMEYAESTYLVSVTATWMKALDFY